MEQIHAYKIDLTKIEGRGDFPCPRCKIKISPDDKTEKTYSILELRVSSHGLKEIVIRCNTCYSHIHLTGFSLLQKIELAEEERKSRRVPFRQFADARAASGSRYKTVERQRVKTRNRCVTFLFLPAACLLWAIGWAMTNAQAVESLELGRANASTHSKNHEGGNFFPKSFFLKQSIQAIRSLKF